MYSPPQHVHERAIVIAGGILLLVHILFWVSHVDRRRLGRAVASVRARLHSARGRCLGRWRPPSRDPVTEAVQRFVDEQRMTLARNMLLGASGFFQIMMLGIIGNIMSDTIRWMSNVNDIVFTVAYALLIAVHLCPRVFHVGTLDAWFSLFMALTCCAVTPLAIKKEALPSLSAGLMVLRFMAGCIGRSFPLIILWNMAYPVIAIVSFVSQQTNCKFISNFTFAMGESLATLVLIMVFWVLRSRVHALAVKDVEIRTSRQEYTAASALINAMSDAVVELDAELCIVGHSSKMAGMLLHGPERSLAGVEFEQLVASDADRQLFHDHMGRADAMQTMANVFHLKLRDSLGNKIRVETFHVCIASSGEGARHLIGVREFGEDGTVRMPVPPQEARLAAAARAEASNAACVKFDALSFEVTQCSNVFAEECGHCPIGSTFKEWLPQFLDPVGCPALGHYTACVNEFVNADADTAAITFGDLVVRPPSCAADAGDILTRCTIILSYPEEASGADVQAEAIFTQIRKDERGAVHSSPHHRASPSLSSHSRSSRSNGSGHGGQMSRGCGPAGSERGRIGTLIASL